MTTCFNTEKQFFCTHMQRVREIYKTFHWRDVWLIVFDYILISASVRRDWLRQSDKVNSLARERLIDNTVSLRIDFHDGSWNAVSASVKRKDALSGVFHALQLHYNYPGKARVLKLMFTGLLNSKILILTRARDGLESPTGIFQWEFSRFFKISLWTSSIPRFSFTLSIFVHRNSLIFYCLQFKNSWQFEHKASLFDLCYYCNNSDRCP